MNDNDVHEDDDSDDPIVFCRRWEELFLKMMMMPEGSEGKIRGIEI
jgi:hypothetical protein